MCKSVLLNCCGFRSYCQFQLCFAYKNYKLVFVKVIHKIISLYKNLKKNSENKLLLCFKKRRFFNSESSDLYMYSLVIVNYPVKKS